MTDFRHDGRAEDKQEKPGVEAPSPHSLPAEIWKPGANSTGDAGPKIVPNAFPQDTHIAGADEVKSGPAARPAFDAHAAAAELNDAIHPAFFSLRWGPNGDRAFNQIMKMSPQEFKATEAAFNKDFAPGDKPFFSGAGSWNLKAEIKHKLGAYNVDRLDKLIESKSHNDVPENNRINGQDLIKAGSELKAGEMNVVTLADNRRYDVYVPKNADNRAPVIVAMHGAAGGDSIGLMAQESGLVADAERTGATVVFAYPKPRSFDIGVTDVTGVAWNAPGRMNLPRAVDRQTDDRVYMDKVLNDLGSKMHMAEKVGMFGFSDGGRFAQVYAADRPERVAAVVSEDGTWMKGDRVPETGKPIMIVHGDADETLPYKGGMGSVSRKMDWLLGTNLDKSAPFMQKDVWREADGCDGPVRVRGTDTVSERDYTGCKVGEVREYIVKGGQHGLNDYKNDGVRAVQWMLGSADRRQDFSTQGAAFLKKWIVSDPSMERPR